MAYITRIKDGERTIKASDLGGVSEIATAFGINKSTMATIASRARAAGIAPMPVLLLDRGAVYVISEWRELASGRRTRSDRVER